MIGKVIVDYQFSFIKGMQILDCALVVNKVEDSTRKIGNEGLMFKFDFERAYESFNWGFLELIQMKMVFFQQMERVGYVVYIDY